MDFFKKKNILSVKETEKLQEKKDEAIVKEQSVVNDPGEIKDNEKKSAAPRKTVGKSAQGGRPSVKDIKEKAKSKKIKQYK